MRLAVDVVRWHIRDLRLQAGEKDELIECIHRVDRASITNARRTCTMRLCIVILRSCVFSHLSSPVTRGMMSLLIDALMDEPIIRQ